VIKVLVERVSQCHSVVELTERVDITVIWVITSLGLYRFFGIFFYVS
jgi:hypothetical protein